MSVPSAIVECDLDDDGTFETDISTYVKAIKGVSFGRDSVLDKPRPRAISGITLDNEDSRFSPENASSPYNQSGKSWQQDMGIRVKLQLTMAAATNLIENPSLETDTVGWTISFATLAQATDEARYGKACGRLHTSAGLSILEGKKRDDSRMPVTGDQDYTFSIYLRDRVGSSLWSLKTNWYDSGGGQVGGVTSPYVTLSGAWQRFELTGTAPATAVTALVQLSEVGSSFTGSDEMVFDGAQFEQASAATPYCDGDVPGSSWSGTAHESTSSRPANPTFTKLVGRIASIDTDRWQGETPQRCTISAVSEMDYLLDRKVYIGNMIQRAGDEVLNVLFDRLERGEVLTMRGAEDPGGVMTWQGVTGYDTAIRENRRTIGAAGRGAAVVEGDWYWLAHNGREPPVTGDGLCAYLAGLITTEVEYRLTLFVTRGGSTANDGKAIRVRMSNGYGAGATVRAETTTTVPASWKRGNRVELVGTWQAGDTPFIEVLCDETFVHDDNGIFAIDVDHLAPHANEVLRDLRLGSGQTEFAELEHVAAFARSPRALLDDIADSIGGIVWEAGDGSFVVEDCKTRLDSPIPILRLTDSAGEQDGVGIPPTAYSRSLDRSYSAVTAISDGDLTITPDALDPLWTLEPANLVLGASATRLLYVRYLTDAGGPIIGDYFKAIATVSAGSLAATQLINYGYGGIVRLTAGGSGATVDSVHVINAAAGLAWGAVRQRGSSRSHVTKQAAGASSRRFERELSVDMPMQGDETTVMEEVAQALADRLISGRQGLQLELTPGSDEELLYVCGLDVSDPVWVRHNTGPGHFSLDEAYYVEGGAFSFVSGELPSLTLHLDRAS